MFPPPGCGRGFPREPKLWRDGPPGPCPPHGHQDVWDELPWERQHRRGRGRWGRPDPRPPRPCPGPDGVPWHEEEDRRWAPHDFPPPPPWDDGEELQGPEENFAEDWYPELLTHPWPEFPKEEQHPPWPPAGPPEERRRGCGGCPPWDCHRPRGRPWRRPRRSHRELTLVPRVRCPRACRGHKPPSKSSRSVPKTSQPVARKELQPPGPPQPLMSLQGAAERPEQTQVLPGGSGEVPKPPRPASPPPKSLATHPCAEELEQAALGTPVELGAGQAPAGSQDQDSCALGAEPAPLEESSARAGEQLEVEPCSLGVPKAGTGDGSHPQSPTAPLDPTEREHPAPSCSGGEGAELSPHSREQQRLPSGAGEAEEEAAHGELLENLQPHENGRVLPEPAAEPDAEPSQACPDPCTPADTSAGPQQPPGAGDTQPAVDGQHQLCSRLPAPSPARDLRSAAVLARKEEIELSYQQFSLTIAVVATMLLQKEPSMEAALGVALRANLRQGRIHHLRELEDFIDSYDSATPRH